MGLCVPHDNTEMQHEIDATNDELAMIMALIASRHSAGKMSQDGLEIGSSNDSAQIVLLGVRSGFALWSRYG